MMSSSGPKNARSDSRRSAAVVIIGVIVASAAIAMAVDSLGSRTKEYPLWFSALKGIVTSVLMLVLLSRMQRERKR